jgi:glycosyltransferase involved in cell wall biosynthesis
MHKSEYTIPLISVIIPVYNGESHICKAIRSVLDQTYNNFELIIVDDGSTDSTSTIVRSFTDKRISYIHQGNLGPSSARNAGVMRSRGEYIAFLDCDDWWLPKKLEIQLTHFQSFPETGLVYCATHIYDTRNRLVQFQAANIDGYALDSMLMGNFISGSASSVMIHRTVLDHVGLFDESLRTCEDWDLWLRIAAMYRICFVRTPLVHLLTRPGSLGKNIKGIRDDSFQLLDKAFTSYAAGLNYRKKHAYAQVHLTAASSFASAGKHKRARQELIASLRLNPINLSVLLRLGMTFFGSSINHWTRELKEIARLAYLNKKYQDTE